MESYSGWLKRLILFLYLAPVKDLEMTSLILHLVEALEDGTENSKPDGYSMEFHWD